MKMKTPPGIKPREFSYVEVHGDHVQIFRTDEKDANKNVQIGVFTGNLEDFKAVVGHENFKVKEPKKD